MVVTGGFSWQGRTYSSLSTIANAMTGTSWNGPRFFGLRAAEGDGRLGEEIASKEGLGVRHVRRLAPLAFHSPKIAQAIAEGSASSGLSVSFLTPALPHSRVAQERMVGLR